MPDSFIAAVAACLACTHSSSQRHPLESLVEQVLHNSPDTPSHDELTQLQNTIAHQLPDNQDHVTLVFGGATKVKEYVFEAPKLPEIRGASALLDWVNNTAIVDLWEDVLAPHFHERLGLPHEDAKTLARRCIIYASGGNVLAVAPAGLFPETRPDQIPSDPAKSWGETLATQIEQTFTDWTLTAKSVAVSLEVPLLSLRYGHDPLAYWVEQFVKDWKERDLQPMLEAYYDEGESPEARFFHRKRFSELVGVLNLLFYQRREQRACHGPARNVALYPLIPWDEQCDSSGNRPAVWRGTIGEDDVELSEASARKRFVGQVIKRDAKDIVNWFYENFAWNKPERLTTSWQEWRAVDAQSWETQWEERLDEEAQASTRYGRAWRKLQSQEIDVFPARDVHEIGAMSQRYIGMIYADGNSVGRFLQQCTNPQDYGKRSHNLDRATKDAVFTALCQHLEPYPLRTEERRVHPFEILTIGGDDLLVIVPGDRALDIAHTIGTTFETHDAFAPAADTPSTQPCTRAERYCGSGGTSPYPADAPPPLVTLSAGVVIAHETAPIFFLRDLVEELLKNAKKSGRHMQSCYGSVDFMVMKSITMVTNKIKTYREQALGEKSATRMTARPYTWPELAGLLETVRRLKAANVPRSQLYRIREVLDETRQSGILPSSLEYLYTRTRLNRAQSSAVLQHIELDWRSLAQPQHVGSSAPPWLLRGFEKTAAEPRWETIWPDLVEIYDLVQQEETTA